MRELWAGTSPSDPFLILCGGPSGGAAAGTCAGEGRANLMSSSMSTSAGSSSCPDEQSSFGSPPPPSPLTPERGLAPLTPAAAQMSAQGGPLRMISTSPPPVLPPFPGQQPTSSPFLSPGNCQQPQNPTSDEIRNTPSGRAPTRSQDPHGLSQTSPALDTWETRKRKVFVGGVPQDIDNEELYAIFNAIAPVERAWLIQHRRDTFHFNPDHVHNHRGFGFVVFRHENAVDQVLGHRTSDFLPIREGRQNIEIKRAISSNEMMKSSRWASAGDGEGWQNASNYHQSLTEKPAGVATPLRSPGPSQPQGPQHQQQLTMTEVTTDVCRPAPRWAAHTASAPMQVTSAANAQLQCFFVPIQMAPVAAPAATATTYTDWTKVFRATPESMLLQAMPDHYED